MEEILWLTIKGVDAGRLEDMPAQRGNGFGDGSLAKRRLLWLVTVSHC